MSIPVAFARIKTPVPPRADGLYESGKRGVSLFLEGPMLRIETEKDGQPQPTVLVPISNVASMTLFDGRPTPKVAEPEVPAEPTAAEPEGEDAAAVPAVEPKPKAARKR